MRVLGVAVCVLAVLCAVAAEDNYEDGVLVLTNDNFDDALKANSQMLVEFYAPWCGHCKKLAPEYSAAAKQLEGENVVLAKVDADSEKELGSRFGVKGFPTLKWFSDGKDSEYNGGRTASDIVSWIKKRTGPVAKVVATMDEVTAELKDKDSVAFIAGAAKSSPEYAAFEKAAREQESVAFCESESALDGKTGLVLIRRGEESAPITFTGAADDAEAIGDWLAQESLPLLVPFNDDTRSRIFGSSIKKQVLVFHDPSEESHNSVVEIATAQAKEQRGNIIFVSMNSVENKNILEFFGVDQKDVPTMFAVAFTADNQMKKYKFNSDSITADSASAFIKGFVDNTLTAHVKSEPVPEQDGPVHVLVGSTFQADVIDNDKDVLVEFYAPWCGHCKKLEPLYNKLAEQLSSIDTIRIAKMDATANDAPDSLNVRGFPTLYFFPAGKKDSPMLFEGDRTVKGMRKFLKKNASHSFTIPKKE